MLCPHGRHVVHVGVVQAGDQGVDFRRHDAEDARPFVAGTHVWVFADFATAQAEHRPHALNFKGVFTRDRRPKLAAHRLKARWRAYA